VADDLLRHSAWRGPRSVVHNPVDLDAVAAAARGARSRPRRGMAAAGDRRRRAAGRSQGIRCSSSAALLRQRVAARLFILGQGTSGRFAPSSLPAAWTTR
jgi:hypothetical protein